MRILTLILLLCFAVDAHAFTKKKKIIKAEPVPVVYAVWNVADNRLIDSQNEDMVHSVASITKLMTVYTVIKSNIDLDTVVTVSNCERSKRLHSGMKITRDELIDLALVSSDNLAACTLAETHPYGYEKFIDKMNEHARELKMTDTHYSDATGLLATNVSSAVDLKKLVMAASEYDIYQESAMKTKTSVVAKVKKKKKIIVGRATNRFAGTMDIQVAKTGFTSKAGQCLTMLYRDDDNTYAIVVLGAKSSLERKEIVETLIEQARKSTTKPGYF